MEMRGIQYFNDLVGSCFFKQPLIRSSVHTNKVTSCKMADCFHQFVMYMVSFDASWCLLDCQTGVYEHALVDNTKDVWNPILVYLHSQSLPNLSFARWKYVRAVVLSCSRLEQLPPGMENLILLQSLDLRGNPLKHLPEAACKWYSLQFLDVSFCYLLLQLPKWIGELQRLQHLRVNRTADELHCLPKEFEKLTLIRSLDVFCIGGGKYESNVAKLRCLNNLEHVCIVIHGEVNFQDADMRSKESMENLELCFAREGRDQEKTCSIMRRFKPPPTLQMLKLKNYSGIRLPRWIQAKSLVNHLKRLSLTSAMNMASLPSLWKLSSLEFLWLYDIQNLKHLGREFFGLTKTLEKHSENENPKVAWSFLGEAGDEDLSDYSDDDVDYSVPPVAENATEAFHSLRTLRIEYLENLETWEDANADDEEKFNLHISVMPSLEELIIADCPKLKILPNCILGRLPSLKIQADDPDIKIPARDQPSSSRDKEISTEIEM